MRGCYCCPAGVSTLCHPILNSLDLCRDTPPGESAGPEGIIREKGRKVRGGSLRQTCCLTCRSPALKAGASVAASQEGQSLLIAGGTRATETSVAGSLRQRARLRAFRRDPLLMLERATSDGATPPASRDAMVKGRTDPFLRKVSAALHGSLPWHRRIATPRADRVNCLGTCVAKREGTDYSLSMYLMMVTGLGC